LSLKAATLAKPALPDLLELPKPAIAPIHPSSLPYAGGNDLAGFGYALAHESKPALLFGRRIEM